MASNDRCPKCRRYLAGPEGSDGCPPCDRQAKLEAEGKVEEPSSAHASEAPRRAS